MIAPWIIEEVDRKNPEQVERPHLRLPEDECAVPPEDNELELERGVVVIRFWEDEDAEE